MDLKNIFNEVIFSAAVDTVKELVLAAIKASADLRGADSGETLSAQMQRLLFGRQI